MEIKDSGKRTQFPTGAVRDMHEANGEPKGRCDLLPLSVVADLFTDNDRELFIGIHRFQKTGNVGHLFEVLELFADDYFDGTKTMLLELAKHFEAGSKKYGEGNWTLGINAKNYVDSSVRHLLKFLRGDEDERHDLAFCWNVTCCIWTCKFMPELNDYAKEIENAEN